MKQIYLVSISKQSKARGLPERHTTLLPYVHIVNKANEFHDKRREDEKPMLTNNK